MVEFGSRRMLPMFPPKSRTFLPPQLVSPSCCAKYVNCPVFVERKATDYTDYTEQQKLISTIKELAIEIVRTAAAVVKGDVEHDDEHAFVNAYVCVGRHVTEIKLGEQRDCALPCFFFQVGQNRRARDRPMDRLFL